MSDESRVPNISNDNAIRKHNYLNEMLIAFKDISAYNNSIDRTIAAFRIEHDQKFGENLEEDEDDATWSSIFIDIELANLHARSILIFCHSAFERGIDILCDIARQPTSISLKDMQGKGIRRAMLFLSKVCHANEPFQSPEWRAVLALSALRNIIVHDSYPDLTKGIEVKRQLGEVPGISFEERGSWMTFTLSKEFATYAVCTYRAMLKSIAAHIIV